MNASHLNSAQDRAYDHVKSQILSLALKPGDWVKAQDIATEVSVSRTPVREALSRLEQEGYVRRDGGWGYVVQSITLKEARDLYKVREALEAEAAREAVGQVTPAQLQALEAHLKKADQARTRRRLAAFRSNTRSFHAGIARLSNNSLLARMLAGLEGRVQLLGAMVFEKHEQRMDEVLEENGAILDALREGDAARAEAEARRHVQRAWDAYLLYVVEDAGLGAAMRDFNDKRRNGGQATIR